MEHFWNIKIRDQISLSDKKITFPDVSTMSNTKQSLINEFGGKTIGRGTDKLTISVGDDKIVDINLDNEHYNLIDTLFNRPDDITITKVRAFILQHDTTDGYIAKGLNYGIINLATIVQHLKKLTVGSIMSISLICSELLMMNSTYSSDKNFVEYVDILNEIVDQEFVDDPTRKTLISRLKKCVSIDTNMPTGFVNIILSLVDLRV